MAPKTYGAAVQKAISSIDSDVVKVTEPSADQLVAICAVRAQLACASALLDVADAIRSNGTGASIERAIGGLEQALRSGAGRRET